MVCGPKIANDVNEFEQGTVLSKEQNSSDFRHEETNSFQKRFCVHVHQLTTEQFRKKGNPFTFESNGLIQVETRDIMHDSVVQTIWSLETFCKQQSITFV